MREAVAVGRAQGVDLPEDYAEQRIGFADDAACRHDLLDAPRPRARQPARSRRWLAGAVVAIGQKRGVPTPLNRAVADILALHANGSAMS